MAELFIGVMTGNSMDAADAVLTAFEPDGTMHDIAFHSEPYSDALYQNLSELRQATQAAGGDIASVASSFRTKSGHDFSQILTDYTALITTTTQRLLVKAKHDAASITAIGLHGQTLAHHPPSIAGKNGAAFTLQIADAGTLANRLQIPVVYDFRSDDIMQGGEGAPLAPMHNRHLAQALKTKGQYPIAFINGGNTSNIALIAGEAAHVVGWDAGPFNHFVDMLARSEAGQPFDKDGAIAKSGTIDTALLGQLFAEAAMDKEGENFLLKSPPKSSDPSWYHTPALLKDAAIALNTRMRTAAYFSAYVVFHSLGYAPSNMKLPSHIAVFGGGWKNPVIFEDFKGLLAGDSALPILPEHAAYTASIRDRFAAPPVLNWSNAYGIDGQAMEARIFADAARCYLQRIPFTLPETTGAKAPVVCGIITKPGDATPALHWSRAAPGWQTTIQAA